jgi:tellurite resistance protein TerC
MLGFIEITAWHWAGFLVVILLFLALDLGVFHREAHVVRFREALGWTCVWFCLALGFAALLVPLRGKQEAVEFVTGYIIELSLSMDNVFVIALIFAYFRVPQAFQHRVLFWGILGALIMRGVMIYLGAALVKRFDWMLYIFGAFLVLSGIKMAFAGEEGVHPEKNPILRMARRLFRISPDYDGQRFLTRVQGRRALTPLAMVLLMVETTDLIFALDSIPAIFGVTKKEFIIFTSNVFAILGLRSLYFVLAGAIDYFRYLKVGLSVVLVFIGAKMLAEFWEVELDTHVSLAVVAGIILTSIVASVLLARTAAKPTGDPPDGT